ncbi:MAG: hypothetical protein V2A69_04435 [Pseudomonadota bacterium]
MGCIKITIGGENLSVLNSILNAFGENKINIWFEVQLRDREDLMSITLCIDPPEIAKCTTLIKEIAPEIDIVTIPSVNIISVFPYRDSPEIAFLFLKALEEKAVPILAISTSLSSISCLVNHEQCSIVQEHLRKAFNLS